MSGGPRFYKRRPVQIGAAVLAIPVLALAWWLGSPLFIDEVVNEPFPRAAMAVIPADMTAEEVEMEMLEAEAIDSPAYEDMPEPTTTAAPTPAPSSTTEPDTVERKDTPTDTEPAGTTATTAPPTTAETATTAPTTTAPAEVTPDPQRSGPVPLVTGPLMDGDSFHKGSGQVTLYRLGDGSHLVRLEGIEVTNGPDLHVLLTPTHGLAGRNDLQAAGYEDLGMLKGNIGSQNYELPAGYEIPEELTLVIYCVPFRVIFATAELA